MDVKKTNNAAYFNISDEPDLVIYSDPTRLCRVSSKVLKAASPVFRALFGPAFAERQAFLNSTADSLPEIQLRDDNAVGLEWLFCILHDKNTNFEPYNNHPYFARQLALLADKYDCIAAV